MKHADYSGQATLDYLVVIAGLIVIWFGIESVLFLLNEHQGELGWALSLPL